MRLTDAELHARGSAQFIQDQAILHDTLFVQPVVSWQAHARLLSIDTASALSLPGVVAVFTASDIPGVNQVGNIATDEKLLADDEVMFVGQVLALVAAESEATARQAAALVTVDYEPLSAVFDVREADRLGMHIAPRQTFSCGDVDQAWADCAFIVEGQASTGAQEHMYLETHNAWAVPLENDGLHIQSATQSPGTTQRIVARILGLPMHAVEVEVIRLGGGFGGKEEQATAFAAMAALVAFRLQRPVRMALQRSEDCRLTGKRHPYEADFKLGLDGDGRIRAYQVDFYQNAGAFADLSLAILERTLFHAGNTYFIPNLRASAVSCRTHLPPNTAFRGFGGPQAMFVLEAALFKAAMTMNVNVEYLQQRNLIDEGQTFYFGMTAQRCLARCCWDSLHSRHRLHSRFQAIEAFNAEHPLQKKGLALMPICFGISFTATFLNQADALVHLYTDGSVSVSCGAVEMGQGVRSKLAKLVANTLGIGVNRVKIESTDTLRVANMSPTAASTGADLNGQAARIACLELKQRLLSVAAELLGVENSNALTLEQGRVHQNGLPTPLRWKTLVSQAYMKRIGLSAQAHYVTPELNFDRTLNQGKPFAYHVYGSAAVEVTVDCLRGTYLIDRVDIVHDDGQPLDEMVDRGQVEGGVVQGLGWLTLEEVVYDAQGHLQTDNLSNYKIPDLHFAPSIDVHFLESVDNPPGLLHSKAVGEPPFMYGIAGYFALIRAILAFNPNWQADFRAPLTPERVLLALYAQQAKAG